MVLQYGESDEYGRAAVNLARIKNDLCVYPLERRPCTYILCGWPIYIIYVSLFENFF